MVPFKIHQDRGNTATTTGRLNVKRKNAIAIENILDNPVCVAKIPKIVVSRPRIVGKNAKDTRTVFQDYQNGTKIQIQENKKVKLGNKENAILHKDVIRKEVKKEPVCLDLIKIETKEPIKLRTNFNDSQHDLFCCTEYKDSIWQYYKQQEEKMFLDGYIRPNYMSKQRSLNWGMRSILVDWLVSVAEEYEMSNQALHLGITYVDRFLSFISVVKSKFQLVGAAALMIAGKLEEIYPPEPKEWSYLTHNSYTTRQVLKMEQLLLKQMGFNLQPPTALSMVKHICTHEGVDKTTMNLAMYLTELVLLEGEDYLEHTPSKVAAASIALARHTIHTPDTTTNSPPTPKIEVWPPTLERASGYTLQQLSPVVQKQHLTFKESPMKEQQAIQNKYKSEKYGKVALLRPKRLLLELEM